MSTPPELLRLERAAIRWLKSEEAMKAYLDFGRGGDSCCNHMWQDARDAHRDLMRAAKIAQRRPR